MSTMLPEPTFVSVDDDGSLNIEWCLGGPQGSPDSWRVLFCWDPDEGAWAVRTTREGQTSAEGVSATRALVAWLSKETL
jgi:hypothetical protein